MTEYPIQVGKVQAPALREETLARGRLLEWLQVKIHRRVVLLVAEAGYGKTTLLADFTRRTRVRIIWYRLDRGDRDWVGFLAYLVAAIRVHMPEFGSGTRGLLRETARSAPPLDMVLDTFLRELGSLAGDASALVFDDFHLVDDSPEVRHIIRELLARAPDRLSLVFATRREPPIRLARLRAQGEVAELQTNDLRFDAAETEQLFRETYEIRIEPAMLAELNRRTEGWAASLQLVRSALNDRDPTQIRAFISSLSGAEGHLYDYLAEEVIGDLSEDLQQFLMRTSLLETVDLTLGPVAAGVTESDARALVEQAEQHGLFGRGGVGARHVARAHPLVRDFLRARLTRAVGMSGIAAIHNEIARAAEGRDWRASAQHYLAAGEVSKARSALINAIETIVATGAFSAADDVMGSLPAGRLGGPAELILRSRFAHQRADLLEGLRLAELAHDVDEGSPLVLLTLVRSRSLVGDLVGAMEASRILEAADEPAWSKLGRTARLVFESSVEGNIETAITEIDDLANELRKRDERHYLGVAYLNSTLLKTALGDPQSAASSALLAIECLSQTSAGLDLVSATLAHAAALSLFQPIEAARDEVRVASRRAQRGQAIEVAIEAGAIEAYLGDRDEGEAWLAKVEGTSTTTADDEEHFALIRALLALRGDRPDLARVEMGNLRYGIPGTSMCLEARRYLTEGLVRTYEKRHDAFEAIRLGTAIANRQGARLWALYGELVAALSDHANDPSPAVERVSIRLPAVISMLAEHTLARLADLTPAAHEAVRRETEARPSRWRAAVRNLLTGSDVQRRHAGELLAAIGEAADVSRLRRAARANKDPRMAALALALARRLAPHAFVEDLGRVRVHIGDRRVDGVDVRRKVLALLCLLLTKPRYTSTREEVADALWPDQDPGSALNSLNQTVYFLRRVFEPNYQDETSPIYVGQDGETIWLDGNLVDSRSATCAELIRSMPGDPSADGALRLAQQYHGRFALDFAYEEWAGGFRDALHAAYLRVMERAIQMDIDAGHFSRGMFMAERASEADPEADEIQAALVRLYRLSGSHAAAFAQYGRYSKTMKDLGLEPRPIEEV